jgi:hypothetical protein
MRGSRLFGEGEVWPLPRPVAPAFPAGGFVVCPPALRAGLGLQGHWAQDVYRLAYQQAQAALTPSWYQRGQVVSAN